MSAEPRSGAERPEVSLIFSVRDTGHGMTQGQLDRLFDKFTRFNAEANQTTEGTGLGMSITRGLVLLMSGEITVESQPGVGSVFTVRLPQGDVDAAPIGKEVEEKLEGLRFRQSPQIDDVMFSHEPMPYGSVLIVDDTETNIYVARGLSVKVYLPAG